MSPSTTINGQNLDQAVSEISAMCEAVSARSEPAFQKALNGKLSREGLAEAGKAAAAAVGPVAREEIHSRLEDVCDFYLSSNETDRERLRGLVAQNKALRWYVFCHAGWCMNRMTNSSDTINLRHALAALSIENNASDWRDTFVALGQIYVKAYQLGMDASGELRSVASISSAVPVPYVKARGDSAMNKFLAEFERSAFFENSVRPKLENKALYDPGGLLSSLTRAFRRK
jgi:hypothetical protein